ncbi:hypothetical protein CONLIGDRAFT_678909 [Coniochaeta ligniaria NRRL 30616]|uniref:Uncharacterized protein n=1 Tax=Coniochaeta ligniaria NRRL 30616 TaxID=1408157 RepID=A0A1J7IZ15_9PEZI|nr:hypothetical protein CONLIGDRAFT_678909 [Coniochaeta ligniaria NRRL 30616]
MPPNHAVMASAGVIAISVAVAAAIAVYESPELRRMAEDLRRRIAIALHSLGENIDPATQTSQEPLFNRPEDAEGFLRSRGVVGDDAGIDADDETRRRQREELMYWNAIRESKQEMERKQAEEKNSSHRGSTFDDFLQEDANAEKGTYVFNTGADVRGADNEGLVRRRGVEGVRGLSSAIYANPFADEYGVDDFDDEPAHSLHALSPCQDEIMSDIYNATEPDRNAASHTLSPQPPQPASEVLFDFGNTLSAHNEQSADFGLTPEQEAEELADDQYMTAGQDDRQDAYNEQSADFGLTPEQEAEELADDQYMTAGQDDRQDAYASIQAWAEASSGSTIPERLPAAFSTFYSPLPVSPPVPVSEPEMVSDGMLTPTEGSTVGSGVDIADEAVSQTADVGRVYDVMSDGGSEGMATPSSWTEVGSVVSSTDEPAHR